LYIYLYVEGAAMNSCESETGDLHTKCRQLQEELERTRIEMAAIQESEELCRGALDKTRDSVVVHQDEKVIYANPATYELLGLEHEEDFEGKSPLDFVRPDQRDEIAQRMNQVVRNGADLQLLEETYIRKNGQELIGEVVARRISYKGRPAGLVIFHDVTESRRAERDRLRLLDRLRRAEKLESLGLLAVGIAHDITNLLHGVMGNLELALTRLPEESKAIGSLKKIETIVKSAAEMVRKLQLFARSEEVEFSRVDLAGLIKETVNMLRETLPDRIQISLELPEGLPQIEADPSQLQQVVMNLLLNATEAITGGPGNVMLHLRHEPGESGGNLKFTVEDEGSGMDQDTMRNAMNAFFSSKGKGRGLGLATTLGIIERHGGRLRVESEAGKGSTFEVILPISIHQKSY
jgi:two-component system, cell cycle sensor histidine kinase and response regulator CckA